MNKLEEQIADIYSEHLDNVYGFFYYKTFDTPTTEDLTSTTFLIFVEKMRKHQKINDPAGFLYGIMKKVWLRHLQQKYKDQEKLIENMDDFMSYVADEVDSEKSNEDMERINSYISKLPDAQRKVMHMRLVEQRSLKEICDEMGKNMNYVKTTQKRGIKTLKALLATPTVTEGVQE